MRSAMRPELAGASANVACEALPAYVTAGGSSPGSAETAGGGGVPPLFVLPPLPPPQPDRAPTATSSSETSAARGPGNVQVGAIAEFSLFRLTAYSCGGLAVRSK